MLRAMRAINTNKAAFLRLLILRGTNFSSIEFLSVK